MRAEERLAETSETLKVRYSVDHKQMCPCCGATWRSYWGGLIRRYHKAGCDYIVCEEINEKYLTQNQE